VIQRPVDAGIGHVFVALLTSLDFKRAIKSHRRFVKNQGFVINVKNESRFAQDLIDALMFSIYNLHTFLSLLRWGHNDSVPDILTCCCPRLLSSQRRTPHRLT
jgi:hypothetical protein